MSKLMIFCTCCDFRKDFYMMRCSNWFHNLKQIKSLQALDPDYYIMHDGELTLEDIQKYDPSLLKESHLYIRNHKPMLGRTSDLSFPGWVRSFIHALEIGLAQYDYIVHIESDVLLLHPDKIVSYFDKPGMFCSHWFGRDIADSTCLVMNDKDDVRMIHDVLAGRDPATNQLIEGMITTLAKWQYVFNGGRLENDASHLTMDLDFIAQLYQSEAVNPYSKSIQDVTANHVYYAITDELLHIPHRQYIPIQCMAESKERFNCYHDDDNPDNIVDKHELYGKLTALYAAWKLDKAHSDQQGVGFTCNNMFLINGGVHVPNMYEHTFLYNDIFDLKIDDNLEFPMMNYDFQQYDIVMPYRQLQVDKNGWIRNVIAPMLDTFGNEFYHTLETVIRENYFDYGHKIWKDYAMDELIAQPIRATFITKKYLFNKFCEFFFDICKLLEDTLGKEKLLKNYKCVDVGKPAVFQALLPYMIGLFCYRNKLVTKETLAFHYINEAGNVHAKPFCN